MARIRSVHPGQWTDEDFVPMSFPARYLAVAIRNEADDQGVFEWKPTTIKMRLLPADNVDVAALLSEMEAHDQVKSFEHDGRKYGAVRNFCKYQRPKKPNHIHFLPEELRTYVALNHAGSEPVPHQDGTSTENPPQRKEEGGSRRRDSDSDKEFINSIPEGIRDPETAPYDLGPCARQVLLKTETFEKARNLAPRYDVYHIEKCWRDWNGDNGVNLAELVNPDKAFLGFVRKHVEANPI